MAISKTTFTDYSTVINAEFLNNLQDEVIDKCVTVESKSFTTAQKTLARANIGAATASDVINRTAYGTCATAAATKAKTVTISDFTLETGATVKVKFTYTNTASAPTLNVNSTGAKSIARFGTTAPGTDVNSSWRPGEVVTFTYDGTYWQMLQNTAEFVSGDTFPSSSDSVFYCTGWITSGLKTVTCQVFLPKPYAGSTVSISYSQITARGINGYFNSSSSLTPDSINAYMRSEYVVQIDMGFETAVTNATNNTPVALYINGMLTFG